MREISPLTTFLNEKKTNILETRWQTQQYLDNLLLTTPGQPKQTKNISDSIYTGIDWLYTSVENLYIYDYKIVYFWLSNNIYDDSYDFFFKFFWTISLYNSSSQLFWSFFLDNYITSQLLQLPLLDNWTNGFIANSNATFFVIYHPEILFFKNQILNNFFVDNLSDLSITAVNFLESQSLLTPIMLFPQLLFVAYFLFFFFSFFFSFYTSATKEESTIDADYLVAASTVESEKEIGSLDDILMPVIILIYTFGWYFYIYFSTILNYVPEITLIFFFFPLLYYTILNTPTFLLYDFGILYNCYLRGVAPSPTLLFELLYDYIAVISFYVRILTQGVRLALMFFTYAAMHDFVLFMDFNSRFITGSESIWEDISNTTTSFSSVTYFLLGVLPGHILNWMYEVFHTFFVVTGQLVAYFGMIFWLFLFLFTFFVIEKQENYFEERRKFRADLLKKLQTLNK